MNRIFGILKIPFIRSLQRDKYFPLRTIRKFSLQPIRSNFNSSYIGPTSVLSIVKAVESSPTSLLLEFQDGIRGDLSYIWLRDNCRCEACYDPDRKIKTVDTVALQEWVKPEYVVSENRDLKIVWLENPQHISLYTPEWLHKYILGFYNYRDIQVHDVLPPVVKWNNGKMAGRNIYHLYDEFMSSEASVDELIEDLYTYGIACIVGTPCNEEEVLHIVNRFNKACCNLPKTFRFDAPMTQVLKQGSYFENFEFHNGLNYRKLHPGIQAVQCLRIFNNNLQRKSFVDGFAIANWMKSTHPEEYRILSTTPVKFKHSMLGLEYVTFQTVIKPDKVEGLSQVHYDNKMMAPFDGPVEQIFDFYRSYRIFGKQLRSEEYQLTMEMKPGDVVIYNDRRILHRWNDFEPSFTGHFSGCYGDFEMLVAQFRQIIKNKLLI